MSETVRGGETSNFLERAQLVKLKQRAMRAGVWFRHLPRIDRVLVDLTIQVADCVRSVHLARSLLAVAGKLESMLESRLSRAVREFGLEITRKLSALALGWGYGAAGCWASDMGFARFWAVMRLNGHPGLG
jgi:hypothetical protein